MTSRRPKPRSAAARQPVRGRGRRAWSAVSGILLVLAVGGWFLMLRPTFLGGSTGYIVVSGTSMVPTFDDRDLVLVRKHDSYRIGDVVAYRIPAGEPGAGLQVIHRIIGGTAVGGYTTQGDNRAFEDQWHPKSGDVIGSEMAHIPWAGNLVSGLRTRAGIAALAGGLVIVLLWKTDEEEPDTAERPVPPWQSKDVVSAPAPRHKREGGTEVAVQAVVEPPVCQVCGRVTHWDQTDAWLVSPRRDDQTILIVRCPKHISEWSMRQSVAGRTKANRQKMAEGKQWDEPIPLAPAPFPGSSRTRRGSPSERPAIPPARTTSSARRPSPAPSNR